MKEEWKAIPGFYRYEISNQGNVRSLVYKGKKRVLMLTPSLTYGYRRVNLYLEDGTCRLMSVARLVLIAFVGMPDKGYEAAHLNGIRTDDRLLNLKWCSRLENHSHKRLHGTHQSGVKHPMAKLTDRQVIEIRESTQSLTDLSKLYGVSIPTIHRIKSRKNWSHI